MDFSKAIIALFSISVVTSVQAQRSLPSLDLDAQRALFQKDTVKRSLADIKLLDARRF